MSVVQDGDLIRDRRLQPGDVDLFDNAAIAKTVADVALTAEPPTNIALFGPWGSGKSSVYTMVEERIKAVDKRTRVVRYDAWKYGGRDLKRHFIASVADELDIKGDAFGKKLVAPAEENELDLWGWLKKNWASLLLGLGLAVGLAIVWVVALAAAKSWLSHVSFSSAVQGLVVASGTVFGLALAALIVGPKVLEGAVVKTVTPPPSGDDEFADRFCDLMEAAGMKEGDRLVVFIDELDRCTPDDVVATLIDLKTFLEQPGCVFIVAVDRDVVEEALAKVPQAKPVRGDEPYYATRGAFLDKIFQHQIALPPLRTRTLTLFARDLVKENGGLWKELRDHDQDLFDAVVFALVPVHVRSPRRIKVLLNAYATNVRIAQSRGIKWLDRATEVAVLTVLQTEFPEVAADLMRVPRLLAFLRGAELDDVDEVRRVVKKYAPVRNAALRMSTTAPSTGADDSAEMPTPLASALPELANPAGDLLSDQADDGQVEVALETIYTQLGSYLTKIAAANITDPRRDLFYLQAAGQRDGLADPVLGDVIDSATDTSPDMVVAAFANQPSSVLALAARLLVMEGEQGVGPGRHFAYESACRLLEQLDRDDLVAVAKDIAPVVLPASAESRWPKQAVPGALLIASAVGQMNKTRTLFAQLGSDGVIDDDLLGRAGRVLPDVDERTATPFHSLLVSHYAARPTPLHNALRTLPQMTALALWAGVQDRVMTAIEQLEQPGAASKGTGAKAPAPATPAIPPTGEGRQRLRELIAAARERADGEALTSAIYAAAQLSPGEPLRAEAAQMAAMVLNDMADPVRVSNHVLTALRSANPAEWHQWTVLLRDPGTDTTLTFTASDVLATTILPATDTVDVGTLDQVYQAVNALLPFVASGPNAAVGEALSALLVKYQWGHPADRQRPHLVGTATWCAACCPPAEGRTARQLRRPPPHRRRVHPCMRRAPRPGGASGATEQDRPTGGRAGPAARRRP